MTNVTIELDTGSKKITVIGTSNDLDLTIPAICRTFKVWRVGERHETGDGLYKVQLDFNKE